VRREKTLVHSGRKDPPGISEGPAMVCPLCQSANQREFTAEINIHFPGSKGLTIPTVCVFPPLSVCLDCGAAQFTIHEPELKKLANPDAQGRSCQTAA
jgi:hypothetical protein